jgi:hypothetical protein
MPPVGHAAAGRAAPPAGFAPVGPTGSPSPGLGPVPDGPGGPGRGKAAVREPGLPGDGTRPGAAGRATVLGTSVKDTPTVLSPAVPADEEYEERARPPVPPQRGLAVLLAVLAVLLFGVLPSVLLLRDAVNDPVYTGLDRLQVPGWAKLAHEDLASGNRYCIGTCRLRERTWQSAQPTAQTDAVYETALRRQGWLRVTGSQCPAVQTGVYTCWEHDQYVMNLWTRDATCSTSQAGGATLGPSAPKPSNELNTVPSPGGSAPPPRTGQATAACPVSQVTAKVGNRIDPDWHR